MKMNYLVKIFILFSIFLLNFTSFFSAGQEVIINDTIEVIQTPAVQAPKDSVIPEKPYHYVIFANTPKTDATIHFADSSLLKQRLDSLVQIPISSTDSLLYASNPLTLPLVYMGKDIFEVWNRDINLSKYLYPEKKDIIIFKKPTQITTEKAVSDLRTDARTYIANNRAELYYSSIDQLPNLETFMSRPIRRTNISRLDVYSDEIVLNKTKIEYEQIRQIYWIKKANAMLQFSQNYISSNWHQGGNSNLAFLSIFQGEMNYDNRKNIQWENRLEWRAGFNSVDGDTLRKISTNDDLVRYLTKFGVKASGNWYYTISGEFTTNILNSYSGINSKKMKTTLLTPFRATIGIGMDYKYKKIFSLFIAPASFKYVYAKDTININPNQFGIKKGENQLKQIGSSFLAQFNYSPLMNWNITSRLNFYTDYKKIEADWEIVNNFAINRYLSARLMLNPRYDNTAILKGGEKKATIQFKELMSVGFSYRFF